MVDNDQQPIAKQATARIHHFTTGGGVDRIANRATEIDAFINSAGRRVGFNYRASSRPRPLHFVRRLCSFASNVTLCLFVTKCLVSLLGGGLGRFCDGRRGLLDRASRTGRSRLGWGGRCLSYDRFRLITKTGRNFQINTLSRIDTVRPGYLIHSRELLVVAAISPGNGVKSFAVFYGMKAKGHWRIKRTVLID